MPLDFATLAPAAERRIRPHVRLTPLEPSSHFSTLCGCNVWFKLENFQHTGSFKVRGALHKLLSLNPQRARRGVVAASTGNHGVATGYALNALGLTGQVYVPEGASPVKLEAIRRWGVELRVHGQDGVETERHARRHAEAQGMAYLSPYNDRDVVLGQATIGVELARQLERIDAVIVALGGGGLASGVAGYLKTLHPKLEAIAASPENSAVMARSLEAGKILALPSKPTISDGTAGGVEPGAITFALCQKLLDATVTVSEAQIKAAMREFMQAHPMLIEGAAGVAVAALLQHGQRLRGKHVAIVICGANIDLETLKAIL